MNFSELATAVLNTLAVCGLCLAVAIPVGTALAITVVRTNVVGRRLAWIAMGSQLAVPLYVFAGGWSAGFGLQGWLSLADWLGPMGMAAMQGRIGSLLAVALIHALAAIPWVCLITSLGLLWTDRSQEETALVEGGWWFVLSRVVLPKLRSWLLASCCWCVIPILTEMVVTNLYQLPTVAEQIYLDASRGNSSPLTYLSAILLCMLPLLGLAWLVWHKSPPWCEVVARAQHFQATPVDLRRWRIPVSGLVWATVLVLVAMPIFNLVAKAGWQPSVSEAGLTSYGWSARRLATTVVESLSLFTENFYWTAVLALAASSLALATAVLVYGVTLRHGRGLANLCMLALLAVPGPLVGMLVIQLLNRNSPAFLGQLYDRTLAAPILAQQFRLLPLAWLLVHTIIAAIPRQSWELAVVDGLSKRQLLWFVVLPPTWSRWLAAGLLLAVTSIGELSSSILVLPPGVTTVSMLLFEMLHFGMRHQDSGLCGILLVLGWCVSLIFWKTLNER